MFKILNVPAFKSIAIYAPFLIGTLTIVAIALAGLWVIGLAVIYFYTILMVLSNWSSQMLHAKLLRWVISFPDDAWMFVNPFASMATPSMPLCLSKVTE